MPTTRWFRWLLTLAACGVLGHDSRDARADDVLTLATTTSTENSGLLAHLHPDFEKRFGVQIKVVAKGTGAALQLARDGNADVVLVHARKLEDEFVAEGYGTLRRDVMYNDFVVIGPQPDPAGTRRAESVPEALNAIAASRSTFLSRGDGSGTHVKEQSLWQQTGLPLAERSVRLFSQGRAKLIRSVQPNGDWYLSIGQGMGKAIVMATEKQAYTLADRGTYYAFALADPARTDLAILCQGDAALFNPYGVIAVNPAKHAHVNFRLAKTYIEWLTSADVQKRIGEYRIRGKVLFHPNAAERR